jgi:hypothetical protein
MELQHGDVASAGRTHRLHEGVRQDSRGYIARLRTTSSIAIVGILSTGIDGKSTELVRKRRVAGQDSYKATTVGETTSKDATGVDTVARCHVDDEILYECLIVHVRSLINSIRVALPLRVA